MRRTHAKRRRVVCAVRRSPEPSVYSNYKRKKKNLHVGRWLFVSLAKRKLGDDVAVVYF